MSNLPTKTKSFIVQNSPVTECDLSLGNETSTFKLVEADLPAVQDGQVLVRIYTYLCLLRFGSRV
jgi:NADPH-dependent curcumin reductase CurA